MIKIGLISRLDKANVTNTDSQLRTRTKKTCASKSQLYDALALAYCSNQIPTKLLDHVAAQSPAMGPASTLRSPALGSVPRQFRGTYNPPGGWRSGGMSPHYRLPDHFGSSVSEYIFRRGIPTGDDSVKIFINDGIIRGLHHGCVPRRRSRLPVLGYSHNF